MQVWLILLQCGSHVLQGACQSVMRTLHVGYTVTKQNVPQRPSYATCGRHTPLEQAVTLCFHVAAVFVVLLQRTSALRPG